MASPLSDLKRPDAIIAGVCARYARDLGVPVQALRVTLIGLSLFGGVGVALYGAGFAALQVRGGDVALGDVRAVAAGWREALGVALLVAAALIPLGVDSGRIVPVAAGAGTVVLLWRGGIVRGRRALLGGALVGVGAVALVSALSAIGQIQDLVVAVAIVVAGTGLLFGPWWVRLSRALTAERTARIRAQERAEVAAHLHDSVLQTLALIQRRASEPVEVAALARRQERDLRAWLNGARGSGSDSLAAALADAASEAEQLHGIAVELVCVGDRALDDATRAIVAATREALNNAARFAGVEQVDVYAEAGGEHVEVFVRDRGTGFDRAAVPADRRGVRDSIEGRMARHGGSATVRSSPGDGTEVRLVL